jgi:hypothetical protein
MFMPRRFGARPSNGQLFRGRADLRDGRQVDAERRPLARRALDRQAATVAVDDMLDDGEPKPGAGPLARLLPLHPVEPLGQPGQVFPGDARASVGDPQRDISLLGRMVGGQQGEMRGADLARRHRRLSGDVPEHLDHH